MLVNFDGMFLCQEFQVAMFGELQATQPDVFEMILKQVEVAKTSCSNLVRDVDVTIYGQFEIDACRRIIKTMDDFHSFNHFEVPSYTTCSTVQNSAWITNSVVIHANRT